MIHIKVSIIKSRKGEKNKNLVMRSMILFQEKESKYVDAIYTNHSMNTNLLIAKVLGKQYFLSKFYLRQQNFLPKFLDYF